MRNAKKRKREYCVFEVLKKIPINEKKKEYNRRRIKEQKMLIKLDIFKMVNRVVDVPNF